MFIKHREFILIKLKSFDKGGFLITKIYQRHIYQALIALKMNGSND